jgi:hypothetical protein
MEKLKLTQMYKPRCKKDNGLLMPERFVMACSDNHIQDFPIPKWIHHSHSNEYDPKKCEIKRSTRGMSGSLSNIIYSCSCGASKSMAQSLDQEVLKSLDIKCSGSKPWLNIESSDCGLPLQTIQKGASNVWFGQIVSSIKIPSDFNEKNSFIVKFIDEYGGFMNKLKDGNLDIDLIKIVYESKEEIKNSIEFDEFKELVINILFKDLQKKLNTIGT